MSGADVLLDDTIPHGTPAGWAAGCTGAHCPAVALGFESCARARERFNGEFGYRQWVKAGMSPAEIAQREARDAAPVVVVKPKPAAKPRPKKEPVIRPVGEPKRRGAAPSQGHGTRARYLRGCKTDAECPAKAAGGQSCREANNERARIHMAARRERELVVTDPKPIEHGTYAGYQRGCRTDDCPAKAAGGVSCTEARAEYQRARRARLRGEQGAEPRVVAEAVTPAGPELVVQETVVRRNYRGDDLNAPRPETVTLSAEQHEQLLAALDDARRTAAWRGSQIAILERHGAELVESLDEAVAGAASLRQEAADLLERIDQRDLLIADLSSGRIVAGRTARVTVEESRLIVEVDL